MPVICTPKLLPTASVTLYEGNLEKSTVPITKRRFACVESFRGKTTVSKSKESFQSMARTSIGKNLFCPSITRSSEEYKGAWDGFSSRCSQSPFCLNRNLLSPTKSGLAPIIHTSILRMSFDTFSFLFQIAQPLIASYFDTSKTVQQHEHRSWAVSPD